ncbi:MAG: DUF4254 domain-containing protein [Candidatus Omnitrophota bacterium]
MKILPMDIKKWSESLPKCVDSLYASNFKDEGVSPFEKTLNGLLTANFTLWGYEDEARRRDVDDRYIADLKRNIDRENQKRNDIIDKLDSMLREDVEKTLKTIDRSLPMNSETPGSIFDRIIILGLRSHNLKKEIERKDADSAHVERCSLMLKQVKERFSDLTGCLEELLGDIYSGKKKIKSYKQHKLYNDPELNPSLRR